MNLPIEVIEAVDEARCILFVGSRFSGEAAEEAGRSYPDGKTAAKALGWRKPKPSLMGVGRPKPVVPSVAEGAALTERAKGRAGLLGKLAELYDTSGVAPIEAHRVAIRRFPLVFTTVYDDLLERAAAGMGGAAEVRYRGDPVPNPDRSKRVIYKMRGGFERPDTLVATRADYERVSFDKEARKAIRNLIRENVIFFVGYRPDEEEFELLFEDLTRCYGGELPRCHLSVAQGRIDDYLWQKWVWRGLLMFTADPSECMAELEARIDRS